MLATSGLAMIRAIRVWVQEGPWVHEAVGVAQKTTGGSCWALTVFIINVNTINLL